MTRFYILTEINYQKYVDSSHRRKSYKETFHWYFNERQRMHAQMLFSTNYTKYSTTYQLGYLQ